MPLEAEGGGRAKTRRDREKHLNEQHLKKRNRAGVDFNAFSSSPLLTVDDLRCWNKSAIILLFHSVDSPDQFVLRLSRNCDSLV